MLGGMLLEFEFWGCHIELRAWLGGVVWILAVYSLRGLAVLVS